jgi:hypothetical protein
LFDNAGNQIFPTDAIDWFFDYVTGILFVQDPGGYSTPYKITVYQYTGKTLTSGYLKLLRFILRIFSRKRLRINKLTGILNRRS